MAREEDDRQRGVGVGKLSLEVQPAQPREAHIEHETSRTIGSASAQELLSSGEDLHPEPHGGEEPPETVTHRPVVVDNEDDVLLYTGRFTQFYRENAKYKERTYTFVERVGLERIRAVVVDDSEGIAMELDAAMQASVNAAYDPWKEATAPRTANQFASLIPAADA